MPASEADDLVAGAQCEVVELDGMVPASRVCCVHGRLGQRRDGGVRGPGSIAGRDWPRHGGRSGGSAELAVHFADVGQREPADLGRLEGFVRESVLPRAHPHTTARRRVLGEASGKPG